MQEIREWFTGPLALSGAIATGATVLAAQACGADLAYVGTAFIATNEANAAAAYKQALVEGTAADIVYSSLFTGVHGNYLRRSIIAAGLDPDDLAEGNAANLNMGDGAAKAWKRYLGLRPGVGAIKGVVPATELVARLGRK